MKRFGRLTSAFEEAGARVRGDRYWHLFILGVAPGHQGQGVGSRLLAPVLAQADAAGERCYLETLEEHNLAFYARHGFAVGEEVSRPGLPTFWDDGARAARSVSRRLSPERRSRWSRRSAGSSCRRVSGSRSPSGVTISDSPSRPTSRPTTTGVSAARYSSRISLACLTWCVRVREAGL